MSIRRPKRGAGSEFFVDPDITRAETLPAKAFTDPGFLEREMATVFARFWQLLPQRSLLDRRDDPRSLKEMVRQRGARVPFSLADRPLFLQRDWKGRLHCFPNVCTHAWHPLVEGAGRERTIACPQHGRQFDCAGRFLSQPGFKDARGFPRECDHLRDFPVEEWGTFLFACLGEPVAPVHQFLGAMRKTVRGLRVERFRAAPHELEVREVEGNWKQHAWNYLDKFHVGFIHRAPGGLADAIELPTYATELQRFSVLQWAYARDPLAGFDPKQLPARFRDASKPERRVFALWWFIFPNLALNFYPWGLSINEYLPIPDRPGRTLFLWYRHVMDEAKFRRRDELWLDRQVDEEDTNALAQVSRGVKSGLAPRGRFSPAEEGAGHWFHRSVYTSVFGE